MSDSIWGSANPKTHDNDYLSRGGVHGDIKSVTVVRTNHKAGDIFLGIRMAGNRSQLVYALGTYERPWKELCPISSVRRAKKALRALREDYLDQKSYPIYQVRKRFEELYGITETYNDNYTK